MVSNAMVNPSNPVLDERPESLNGVRVGFANDVDAFAVIDSPVRVSSRPKSAIGAVIIGKDKGLGQHMLFNESPQRVGFRIGSNKGTDFAFALNHADNSNLVRVLRCWPTALAAAPVLGSEIAFVHFDLAVPAAK